jgi:hypothetical protein
MELHLDRDRHVFTLTHVDLVVKSSDGSPSKEEREDDARATMPMRVMAVPPALHVVTTLNVRSRVVMVVMLHARTTVPMLGSSRYAKGQQSGHGHSYDHRRKKLHDFPSRV